MTKDFNPDFLLIPYEIFEHSEITPVDATVYAVVYWHENLKDGECFASNATIAKTARTSPRTVANSLVRLEKLGFIKREYHDLKKRNRTKILCQVSLKRHTETPWVSLPNDKVSLPDEQIKNIKQERNNIKILLHDVPIQGRNWMTKLIRFHNAVLTHWLDIPAVPVPSSEYGKLGQLLKRTLEVCDPWIFLHALIYYPLIGNDFVAEAKFPLALFPRNINQLMAELAEGIEIERFYPDPDHFPDVEQKPCTKGIHCTNHYSHVKKIKTLIIKFEVEASKKAVLEFIEVQNLN